jgi:hypothetical protein
VLFFIGLEQFGLTFQLSKHRQTAAKESKLAKKHKGSNIGDEIHWDNEN